MDDEEKMHLRIKNPQILVRNCKFRTVDLSPEFKQAVNEYMFKKNTKSSIVDSKSKQLFNDVASSKTFDSKKYDELVSRMAKNTLYGKSYSKKSSQGMGIGKNDHSIKKLKLPILK